MTQWVSVLAAQAWYPEFNPQNMHKCRREPTPQNFPTTSPCVAVSMLTDSCLYVHMHKHTGTNE